MRRLVQRALAEYAVPVARLTVMGGGWNTTYRVEEPDGQRYVMRVQREDGCTPEMVRDEMAWLTRLRRDTDLVVPDPVPTRDGDLVAVAEDPLVPGARGCVLYRWVDGRFLNGTLTEAHLFNVGVLTARLQEHGATMPRLWRRNVDCVTEFGKTRPDGMSPECAAQAADLVREVYSEAGAQVVLAVMDRVRRVKEALGDAHGLIHADLHHENYLFRGAEARVIDFDDCGYGHYVYDLAVTIFELPGRQALHDALLAGYRSVRPFPPEHEQAIPTFMALRWLQMGMYQLEHRDEPRFRDTWATELDIVLTRLGQGALGVLTA